MSISLHVTMAKWAPHRYPIDVGFVLANEGQEAVYVNRRCSCGPPSSGADIAVEVYDLHGRRVVSRRPDIPPPTAADFVRMEPGARVYGSLIYDLLRDHDMPVGKYVVQLLYRRVDDVPAELAGRPVFTDMIHPDNKRIDVIQWGQTPPGYETGPAGDE